MPITTSKSDHFLADAVGPRPKSTVGYMDGLRFGFGLFTAGLLMLLLLGGAAWGVYLLMGPH